MAWTSSSDSGACGPSSRSSCSPPTRRSTRSRPRPIWAWPASSRSRSASADPSNWLRVKTLLRTAAPSCVLIDAAEPTVFDFFDACKRELEGRTVLLLCADEDFNTARQLLGRLSNVKCVSTSGSPSQLLRTIRLEVTQRRQESERARAMLAQQLARCEYAAPLHTGYYCTMQGPCPFGEQKDAAVTVRGKDHHRCPKRPFVIPNADRVGLITWSGLPDRDGDHRVSRAGDGRSPQGQDPHRHQLPDARGTALQPRRDPRRPRSRAGRHARRAHRRHQPRPEALP